MQDPAAIKNLEKSKKARRSSGLREILSLALELGASSGASAVPVTWDGSTDTRRASRAKPAEILTSPPPVAVTGKSKAAKAEEGAKAGTTAKATRSGVADRIGQPVQTAANGKGEKAAEALSSGKKAAKTPSRASARESEAAKAKPAATASKAVQQKGTTPVAKVKQETANAANVKKGGKAKEAKTKLAPAKVRGAALLNYLFGSPESEHESPPHPESDMGSIFDMVYFLLRTAENAIQSSIIMLMAAGGCRSQQCEAEAEGSSSTAVQEKAEVACLHKRLCACWSERVAKVQEGSHV